VRASRHLGISVAFAATVAFGRGDALADSTEGHRLRVALSPGSFGFYDLPGADGHYSQKGVWAFEARVAYGYRLARNLELGALTSGTVVQGGDLTFVRLQGVVRGILPLGDAFELGGQFRVGLQESHLRGWNYFGYALALGIDAEIQIADPVWLALGTDMTLGQGSPTSGPAGGLGDTFRNANLWTIAIVPHVGASIRF
jgi:hypothetical protein